MRMIAIGDLHIGCHARYFELDDPYLFVRKSLKYVFEHALRKGIYHITLLGDLFDSPNPSDEDIIFLISLLLSYPKLTFYVYPGNHDTEKNNTTSLDLPVYFGRKLKVFPNIKFFSRVEQIVVDNVPVTFLPWPFAEKPAEFKPGLVFAHVTIGGALMSNGYAYRSSLTIKPGKDFWVIGDVHKYQVINKRVIYPGTLYQVTYGEGFPKGFLEMDVSISKKRGCVVDWKFCPVQPPYTLNSLAIETASDLKKVTSNPFDQYKLKVAEDVAIDQEWLDAHPNVVDSKRLHKSLAALSDMDIVEHIVHQNVKGQLVTKNLSSYLVKKGLKPKRAKKAVRIVKEIADSLKA